MQKKQKKEEKKECPKKSNIHFLGGLENGQEVVPPFFSKKSFFFIKNPIFIVFPEKNGWQPFFFKKAMLQGGQT